MLFRSVRSRIDMRRSRSLPNSRRARPEIRHDERLRHLRTRLDDHRLRHRRHGSSTPNLPTLILIHSLQEDYSDSINLLVSSVRSMYTRGHHVRFEVLIHKVIHPSVTLAGSHRLRRSMGCTKPTVSSITRAFSDAFTRCSTSAPSTIH